MLYKKIYNFTLIFDQFNTKNEYYIRENSRPHDGVIYSHYIAT